MAVASRAAWAQVPPATRLLMLQAEERRVATAADLRMLRLHARSRNPDAARAALRTLGRLERLSVVPDILAGLRHALPEVRAQAAIGLAQAAQGLRSSSEKPMPGGANLLASIQSALTARLGAESDASVRAALCEALARLPYRLAADVERAERAILGATAVGTTADRLGLARALEALVRLQAGVRAPGLEVVAALRQLVRGDPDRSVQELQREARVRRLALDALISAVAVDRAVIEQGVRDGDSQVRRLAMRAIAITGEGRDAMAEGLADASPMVRLEALRALRTRGADRVCEASLRLTADADMGVALIAIDQLSICAQSADAVSYLQRTVGETSDLRHARGWHRGAHALVALATAAPDRAAEALAPFVAAPVSHARLYAARAASEIKDRAALEALATDADDRVANLALTALDRPPRAASSSEPTVPPVTAADMRRLAAARAHIVIRDVGRIELALLADEAPGVVVRFAALAEAGYYDGLAFDRLAPNAIAQAGERPVGERASYPGREATGWPHVRGTVGVLAPETGDAQFFINLVDNPRFDHRYAVFAQVLNGIDVVDRILEGDVIESIEIVH